MQPLPVPAPGPVDLLGCWRHRGSSPPIYAWLGCPAPSRPIGNAQPSFPVTTIYRCKFMYSSCFLFTLFEFLLGPLLFCYPPLSPSPWPDISSVHPISSSLPFWIDSLIFSLPLHFLLIHLVYLNLHEHWFLSGWLFSWSRSVHSTSLWRNSCIRTYTYNTQVLMVVLWWTCWYPCQMKGLLRLVCNVKGGAKTTWYIILTKDRCERCYYTCVTDNKTNNICQII